MVFDESGLASTSHVQQSIRSHLHDMNATAVGGLFWRLSDLYTHVNYPCEHSFYIEGLHAACFGLGFLTYTLGFTLRDSYMNSKQNEDAFNNYGS